MILAELAIIVWLVLINLESIYIVLIVSILISFISFLHLINKETNPEYKVSWSFIIFALPPIGSLLLILSKAAHKTRDKASRWHI